MPFPRLSSFVAFVATPNEKKGTHVLWDLGGAFQFDFNAPPNSVEEVLQNVYEIFSVPIGSQVFLRAFGNDVSWIDSPGNIAEMQAQTAFLMAVSRWEPRAKFSKIKFTLDTASMMAGVYSLYVELTIDLSVAIQARITGGPPASPVWVINNPMTGALTDVELDKVII